MIAPSAAVIPMPTVASASGNPVDVTTVVSPVHVMHVVDTLDIGGAERMAVNFVNALPRSVFRVSLCTTRRDGPLAEAVASDVTRLRLGRRSRFELKAVTTLVQFIRREAVRLLHVHGTTLFLVRAAVARLPRGQRPVVVWHDHFGRYATEQRPVWLYRLAASGVDGVISVNSPLVEWARTKLKVAPERSWFVSNFVVPNAGTENVPGLPGEREARIVCVANLRPQKDHLTLIRAMARVVESQPRAHLFLAGDDSDASHVQAIRAAIVGAGLSAQVSMLGARPDVPALVRSCAIGVLSSTSEGLPLALLEYGLGGVAAVATDVGECAAVFDGGDAGILVRPGSAEDLAYALVRLLESPELRMTLGSRLRARVYAAFTEAQAVRRVSEIYGQLIARA